VFDVGAFAFEHGTFGLERGMFGLERGMFALERGTFALERGTFAFERGTFACLAGGGAYREETGCLIGVRFAATYFVKRERRRARRSRGAASCFGGASGAGEPSSLNTTRCIFARTPRSMNRES